MQMLLVTQMFPATLMLVPLYALLQKLHLLDSLLGLVLVYSTTALPFCVWMLKGYFDTIPRDLEEAALLDGATHGQIFLRVVLPLARPALAVTTRGRPSAAPWVAPACRRTPRRTREGSTRRR